MSNFWKSTTLGTLCEISTGKSNANEAVDDAPYAFFDRSKTIKRSNRYLFDCEALIIPGEGAEFFPRYYSGKFDLHQRAYALFNFDSSVDIQFVYWHLIHFHKYFERVAVGATAKSLRLRHFTDLPISFPPLPEQHRIVKILDEVFAAAAKAKENAEKNLQNARELFRSHLHSVFAVHGNGLPERSLVDLCETNRVITYGVIKLGEETPGGVPCLRTSNVRWLNVETEGMKRIKPSLSKEYSRTILKGGEVLVNVRGTLGGVAVATSDMAGWNVSREVAMVPVDATRVNPRFLSYFIGSGASQQWLGGVKKGAAYIGINIEDLRQLPVRRPQ
ncbi:MAG: restriction endonuclease subunit S [Bacteroidetes bacterium]|nr:restriction endonuclease subunit S [Bacteroidota bacterium]